MFTNSAGAKITQKVIQAEKLFTSEFENPLKDLLIAAENASIRARQEVIESTETIVSKIRL
jgi:hypothetical protein